MLLSSSRLVLFSAASFVSLIVLTGCDGRPGRISPPKVKPETAAANAMTLYDANKDGKISGDEFESCSSLKAIAQNGEVTADLISAQVAKWQQGKLGRVNVSVMIFHNGKPLAGASVRLMPEKFMGSDIASCTATTDARGGTPISVPTKDPGEPQGISPGFYRLEVTKDGENIPAKYNAETTLCLAVLGDVLDRTFNLLY
jgi:hypothetical protein